MQSLAVTTRCSVPRTSRHSCTRESGGVGTRVPDQAASETGAARRSARRSVGVCQSRASARAIVADADAAILAAAIGGQITAVLVAVTAEGVVGASVGDSEAWIVRVDDVVKLTDGQQREPLLGTGDAHTVPWTRYRSPPHPAHRDRCRPRCPMKGLGPASPVGGDLMKWAPGERSNRPPRGRLPCLARMRVCPDGEGRHDTTGR